MPEVIVKPDVAADPGRVPAGATDDGKGGVAVPADQSKPEEKLILGKFKTQGDLEKAYTELETKQGATQKKEEAVPAPAVAQKAVQDAGFDLSALATEVSEKGELSAETLTSLEGKGQKDAALALVDGWKAQAAQLATEIQGVAGGAEKYDKALDWAQANQTDAQVRAFNSAIHSGNVDLAKLAVKGLMSDYNSAVGSDPNLVKGDGTPSVSGIKPYESQHEMISDMKDKRYKEGDPAFVKRVENRIAVSKIFG